MFMLGTREVSHNFLTNRSRITDIRLLRPTASPNYFYELPVTELKTFCSNVGYILFMKICKCFFW